MKNVIAAIAVVAAGSANADIILQYATAGGSAALAPTIADAAVAADDLVAGPGLTVLNFSTFNFSGWDDTSTSAADAIAAGDFWTWGFTVSQALTTVTLSDFDIRLDRSGTGPDDFEISYSINGGADVLVLSDDFGDSGAGRDYVGTSLGDVELSTGDSIVFTLAAFNSESNGGTFDLETVDFNGSDPRSLRLNGSVEVIPAPASAALLGLGGLFASRRRG